MQINLLPLKSASLTGIFSWKPTCRQVPNISSTLVGNKIVDHSDEDVVGAAPTGDAPTTSSFSIRWIGQRQLQDEKGSI